MTIRNYLEELRKENGIKAAVADFILESTDDDHEAKVLLSDVVNYGCISGVVSDLIYTSQTHDFFDEHYNEIMELRQDYEYNVPVYEEDIKEKYAWFGFEVRASEIYSMIEDLDVEEDEE